MLNAQARFQEIKSPEDLEKALLTGDTFRSVQHIDRDGLLDLFNVLSSGTVSGAVFGKGAKLKPKKDPAKSELTRLRSEKAKIERALERLRNLYLFSDSTMPESEYFIQQAQLSNSLDEINAQIGIINTSPSDRSLSDSEFVQRASEFLIAQKLSGRNYINYKRLAVTVDASVLQSFVQSIIDSITVSGGSISKIVFRNGLSHSFRYK